MTTKIITRTVRGLEWVAAAEVADRLPRFERLLIGPREVTFELDELNSDLTRLQTVDDAFLEVALINSVGATKADIAPLVRQIASLDWHEPIAKLAAFRDLPSKPAFDVVASIEGQRTYNRFEIENAIGAAVEPYVLGTHLPRTRDTTTQPITPDFTIRIFLRGSIAVIAVRLCQRPMHRRAYKQNTGAGTLHPPVAAALGLIACPQPGETIADPFCGDGTIAVETALRTPGVHFRASDIDPARVDNARHNAERAGVEIDLAVADASQLPWASRTIDAIITNPPWNLAVKASGKLGDSLDPFWRQARLSLTTAGRICLIADTDLKVPMRLRSLGYQLALAAQIRMAGRVSDVILAAPAEGLAPALPTDLANWREHAISRGIVTNDGW